MTNQSIRTALTAAQRALDNEAKLLESQLLLGKVLEKDRAWLIAHDDELLSDAQQHAYEDLVAQRCEGHPIAYLLGVQEFWSLMLSVTPATLIPRPETECLVEAILGGANPEPQTILDLGTGSGAIALALAAERKLDTVIALDRSEAAIKIARKNQVTHQLQNVHLFVGSWTEAIADHSIDIIVSNPPYVERDDHHLSQLRYEPISALASGLDGLDDIRQICVDAKRCLKPGGKLAIEHGFDQQSSVIELCQLNEFHNVSGHRDLQGQPRFVLAEAP